MLAYCFVQVWMCTCTTIITKKKLMLQNLQ